MKQPDWVLLEVVYVVHEESLAQFGGSSGIRDQGLLESALARPRNLFIYGKPTIFELASSYAFGLVKNHPFIDGNKRTALIVAASFLEINGWRFSASEVDAAVQTFALAASDLTEAAYALWLEANSRRKRSMSRNGPLVR